MPFFAANCSHFVGVFSVGTGFSRGSGVLGVGRCKSTPSEVDFISQVERSWFTSAWAASRAVAWRVASSGFDGSGLGSFARRLPRSKVYGVGLLTVTGLVDVLR